MGLIDRLLEPADWAIERPLVELRNEAADALEKLRGYARHKPFCPAVMRLSRNCTCGLTDLIRSLTDETR